MKHFELNKGIIRFYTAVDQLRRPRLYWNAMRPNPHRLFPNDPITVGFGDTAHKRDMLRIAKHLREAAKGIEQFAKDKPRRVKHEPRQR